jgi:SAM-dependent methyltransferase
MPEAQGPNAEQIEYWNEQAGPQWVRQQEQLDGLIGPIGSVGIERAAPVAGERVLDVGCGCGQSSLLLAERVAPGGRVTGLDISQPMLARARERAEAVGAAADFTNADAQTYDFAAEYDLIFSRFGVMFFAEPKRAFANLASALVPGGRITFVCWQAVPRNPWVALPMAAAAQHVEMPAPAAPDAPGPFSFADPERVRGILEGAGFADVGLESLELQLALGGDLEAAVQFLEQVGPTSRLVRDAAPDVLQAVRGAMRAAVQPFVSAGGVRMPSATWIVTGRRL